MKYDSSVYVATNGCPENRIDSARIVELFRENGWKVANDFRKADIIFFNTCGLDEHAEKCSLKDINYLKINKNPSTELVICGCLPKINKNSIRDIYQGITFGSDDLVRLDEMFAFKKKSEDIHANFLIPIFDLEDEFKNSKNYRIRKILLKPLKLINKYYIEQAINAFGPGIFPIKVSTGCLNNCSFCGVKLSRGNLKSKPINRILKEVEEGLDKNYKEFGLIGTDVGSYGRDLGANLVILLREIIKKKGDFKIRLRNIQPRFLIKMMPELREVFQTGKISYLATAAESGSDRILGLMNRGYMISDYKEAIRTINKEFPKILLHTQLMVGFPTESEEDFKDTCRLLDELIFDCIEVYRFEGRPGTQAVKMKGQIDRKTKRIRYHRLMMRTIFNQLNRKKTALLEYKKRLDAYS